MGIFIVVVNPQAEESKECVTHKLLALAIPQIGVGIEVILINIVIHAYEIFKIPNIILKDAHVTHRLGLNSISLVEPTETTC